jgi:hypothetical protein
MTSSSPERTVGLRRCLVAGVGGLLAALMVGTGGVTAAAEPIKVAVFPFELVDTSQEGEMGGARADQQARLELLTAELATLLSASGRYEVVSIEPVRSDYDRLGPMRGCNGCDIDLARAVGAEQGMVGIVQKVSNLILDVALYVRDVKTGRVVQVAKTSIRGNTDESWLRGLRFLVDKRILAETPAATAN